MSIPCPKCKGKGLVGVYDPRMARWVGTATAVSTDRIERCRKCDGTGRIPSISEKLEDALGMKP